MFRWSKPSCPIAEDDRLWIERRMTWLCRQFGRDRLQFGTVVLPTRDFFPEFYEPTEAGVHELLARVCDYMAVDPRRVSLGFFSQLKPIGFGAELIDPHTGAAGIYDEQSGKITIWLEKSRLHDPHVVVATLAHELGHVHLLADHRLTDDEPDHEALTDLLTVFFGLGIFTANAILGEAWWRAGEWAGYSIKRQGHLTSPLFGFAMALCARCRQEEPCPWRDFLRLDVKAVFDKSLTFLERSGAPRFPNRDTGPTLPPGAFPALAEMPAEASEDATTADSCEESADTEGEPLDINAELADGCFERALIHYQAGAFAEAIAEASEAIGHSPDDAEAYTLRAQAYLGVEKYRLALEDAERAVALDADDTDARRARGVALLNTGDAERALTDFDFLIRQNRHDADAYYQRGLAYAALGEHRRALGEYSRAMVKNPHLTETYFARHQAYKDLGEHDRAEADLQEGLRRRARLA
jgi:tetratricopeptide (TPR) repeat protein